jgi:uncharacterized membrane protein
MALVGLLFTAGIYPVTMILWHRDQPGYTDAMMLSLYFVLGILLLLAVRSPAENRSLIAFAAWSSAAHAAVMAIMTVQDAGKQRDFAGVYVLVVIAITLIALFPAKQSAKGAISGAAKD